ncbi:MAG: efflux RND transporter periplasmic adaptor subunit [Opitutaceae bacterium]
MKALPFLILVALTSSLLPAADNNERRANTVLLDATGVQNLRLATEVNEPREFEETVFALGRIEIYPGNRAVLSSRIAGSARDVFIKHDHSIKQGEPAIVIESRQVGNPPPRITINAPISGLVSAVHVVPGQPVSPEDTLAEILDLSDVYALARVPEQLASQLRSGQRALLSVVAVEGETFTADLEHLGALADPVSGTVEAAFHVTNRDLKLRPGMRAEFSIVVSQRSNVTSVPRAALQGTPANRFVYVKDFELPHAFVKTPVVTGQSNDRRVEIISGLLPYDEVVTQGAYSLAFAGGGSLSLKEALDAAHGPEHNADGSELSAADTASSDDADAHGHAHDSAGDRLWKMVSGVLFVALLAVSFFKSRSS